MGSVHRLILSKGVEGARATAVTKAERNAIEAAAAVLSEEESRLGITHAGFAMTSLPHKRIEEASGGEKATGQPCLVESGPRPGGRRHRRAIRLYCPPDPAVPPDRSHPHQLAGSRARPIDEVWMARMSLTTGGRTYQLVTEQARRISACRLTFFTERENGAEARHNGAFVRDAISLAGVVDDHQPTLWQDRVRLDDGFWRSLRDHPVPVREEAIKAIGTRSLAIDVYIWLAYRLHSLTKSTPVSWPAVHGQFGAGFRLVRQIKPTFSEALNLALAVYPEARVDIEKDGIVLHPSAPAVPKAEARRLGLT